IIDRNLVRFYAKTTTIPTNPRTPPRFLSRRRAPSEREPGADRVGHERLAEPGTHRMLGPPPGAVRGHDHARPQGGQVIQNPRDERLEQRPVQMKAAEHRIQRAVPGEPPRVPADV